MKWIQWNRNKVTDERIVHTQNKIYREIYNLIMFICGISVLFKLINGESLVGVRTELLILILSGVYYLVRAISSGIYSDSVEIHDRNSKVNMNTKNTIGGLVLGVGLGIIFGLNSAIQYAEGVSQSLWYFFLVFFVSLIIYIPVFLLLTVGVHTISTRISAGKNKDEIEE